MDIEGMIAWNLWWKGLPTWRAFLLSIMVPGNGYLSMVLGVLKGLRTAICKRNSRNNYRQVCGNRMLPFEFNLLDGEE